VLAKLYRKELAKVKVAGKLSEWFCVKKGVGQGCVLSPYLFSILAEMVMRETLDGFQESIRMTEDWDKWRKYVRGVADARIEDGQRREQNSTSPLTSCYFVQNVTESPPK